VRILYEPKLPVTGVPFLALGLASFYNNIALILFILTLTIILFRFIRLLVKEGKIKRLFIIPILLVSSILLITALDNAEADSKFKQSDEILKNYKLMSSNLEEADVTEIKSINENEMNNFEYYPNSGEVIGSIYIEKIKLEMPIIEDSTDENLWLGAAHIKGTPLPWEKGNSFLASHNIINYGELFNRLDELDVGDKINIYTDEGNFNYVVYDKGIVLPNDTECFNKFKGEYDLSLVTCTDDLNNIVVIYCERL
jgi:sortase A